MGVAAGGTDVGVGGTGVRVGVGAGWDVPQATNSSKLSAKPIIFGDNLM